MGHDKQQNLTRENVSKVADRLLTGRSYTREEFKSLRMSLSKHLERGVTANALRKHLKALGYSVRKKEETIKPKLNKLFLGKVSDSGRIGFVSRIDYGSEGFRVGLLEEMRRIFEDAGVEMVVIAGGLFAGKALENIAPKGNKKALERALFVEDSAKELADLIPKMKKPDGTRMPIFIVISKTYDTAFGYEIAKRLVKIRRDINLMGTGHHRFYVNVDGVEKHFTTLVPMKGPWMRGQYHSTHTQRVLRDFRQVTSEPAPDFCVVGCFAVSILKPKGEVPDAYTTVPALHKLSEESSMENQVGVTVVTITKDGFRPLFYSLKHLLNNDRRFVKIPEIFEGNSLLVLEAIQRHGALTVGRIVDKVKRDSGVNLTYGEVRASLRDLIQATAVKIILENRNLATVYEIEGENGPETTYNVSALVFLIKKKTGRVFSKSEIFAILDNPSKLYNWPGLTFNSDTETFDLDLDWIQINLRYDFFDQLRDQDVKIDRMLAFGCLHAMASDTDYEMFLRDFPRYILDHDIKYVFGLGDFIEGINHDLILEGSVIAGANLSKQEKVAGRLVKEVLFKVFEERFSRELAKVEDRLKLTQEDVLKFVERSLIVFYFIQGNHCLWSQRRGYDALNIFELTLREELRKAVTSVVSNQTGKILDLTAIIDGHLLRKDYEMFTLPSGISVELFHPHMARTFTNTGRAQQTLAKSDAQVVLLANFHTDAFDCEYSPEMGQRVSMQVGTLKWRSPFEDHKLKRLDTGGGGLVIYSKDSKILAVQAEFFGQPRKISITADDVLRLVLREMIGIDWD